MQHKDSPSTFKCAITTIRRKINMLLDAIDSLLAYSVRIRISFTLEHIYVAC